MSYDHRIWACRRDFLDNLVAIPVRVEGRAVFAFGCPTFQENETDVRRRWEQSFEAGFSFVSVSCGRWGEAGAIALTMGYSLQ